MLQAGLVSSHCIGAALRSYMYSAVNDTGSFGLQCTVAFCAVKCLTAVLAKNFTTNYLLTPSVTGSSDVQQVNVLLETCFFANPMYLCSHQRGKHHSQALRGTYSVVVQMHIHTRLQF